MKDYVITCMIARARVEAVVFEHLRQQMFKGILGV